MPAGPIGDRHPRAPSPTYAAVGPNEITPDCARPGRAFELCLTSRPPLPARAYHRRKPRVGTMVGALVLGPNTARRSASCGAKPRTGVDPLPNPSNRPGNGNPFAGRSGDSPSPRRLLRRTSHPAVSQYVSLAVLQCRCIARPCCSGPDVIAVPICHSPKPRWLRGWNLSRGCLRRHPLRTLGVQFATRTSHHATFRQNANPWPDRPLLART